MTLTTFGFGTLGELQLLETPHFLLVNNCIAKMETECLRHPGASTIGSQLLDEDCICGWQILETEPWALMQKWSQAAVTLN